MLFVLFLYYGFPEGVIDNIWKRLALIVSDSSYKPAYRMGMRPSSLTQA
jgi:hypothetical protein